MEKLYIKFIEGNEKSLNRAIKIAEGLGYTIFDNPNAIKFEGYGILCLDEEGDYFTSNHSKGCVKDEGYLEYKTLLSGIDKKFMKKYFGHEWTRHGKVVRVLRVIFKPIRVIVNFIKEIIIYIYKFKI